MSRKSLIGQEKGIGLAEWRLWSVKWARFSKLYEVGHMYCEVK